METVAIVQQVGTRSNVVVKESLLHAIHSRNKMRGGDGQDSSRRSEPTTSEPKKMDNATISELLSEPNEPTFFLLVISRLQLCQIERRNVRIA
ncbi:hypothetical protein K0M31_003673 [Melipona bicolor]|uniref:Uncharacterized protein n=1 Tax=Melipona bicolor TaxID=60889 RepID=A0AA40KNT8_9HYME|nr:hypothetical protein K0M31_003673 [Melipona bicolor]